MVKHTENTPIGQGGMATIFKAVQESLDREVVIKRIKDELKTHPTILKRFEREAKASARLLHQNLSHVYDYVTTEGSPYIVMEYIDGVDVADILARRGTTPIYVGLAVMLGVTRALAYIHSYGLVHRDIKPENIRISKTGDVKLMDFGIALKQAEESKLTLPGIIIGSPHYLSPEQILGETIGPRSDLFSLGITLYELLTGSRPFDSPTQETVFYNIRKGIFTPARKVNRNIPVKINSILNKLLKPDPNKRYASAWDVHRELRDFLEMDDERPFLRQYLLYESLAEPGPHEEVKAPRLVRRKPFRNTMYGVLISLFLIGFGGISWYTGNQFSTPIQGLMERVSPNSPNFCLASVDEASRLNRAERDRILHLIYEQGYSVAGIPELIKVKLDKKTQPKYRQYFSQMGKQEQKIVLGINKAASVEKLFARKANTAIWWPSFPPCEKF